MDELCTATRSRSVRGGVEHGRGSICWGAPAEAASCLSHSLLTKEAKTLCAPPQPTADVNTQGALGTQRKSGLSVIVPTTAFRNYNGKGGRLMQVVLHQVVLQQHQVHRADRHRQAWIHVERWQVAVQHWHRALLVPIIGQTIQPQRVAALPATAPHPAGMQSDTFYIYLLTIC